MKKIIFFGFSFFLFTSCGPRIVTTSPDTVVVVNKAAKNHRVVYVNGRKYYHWNGNHYRKTRRGYVIVKI